LGHEVSHTYYNAGFDTALVRYALHKFGFRFCADRDETADDVLSNAFLKVIRQTKPYHVRVDGQHRTAILGAYGQTQVRLDDYEQLLYSLHTFLKLTLFVAAFRAVVEALGYVLIIPIRGVIGLRDLIKALNLPKHLFPQSLRPIKTAAL
jgi:hypothetical protein